MVDNDLFRVVSHGLTDPETVEMIKRALAQGVILDTWMNGEEEEQVSEDAQVALVTATERWTADAVRTRTIFPSYPMPEQYVRSVFHEVLFSMALYAAQKKKGRREVSLCEVEEAVDHLDRFVTHEPRKLTVVGVYFFIVSAHEDLNAIAYYGRMKKEDFLFGKLHRPWSNLVLGPSLCAYQQMDLIRIIYSSEGDMLSLTQRGQDVLAILRGILSDAGELNWRSDNQRWVIFGETDYDRVYSQVFPDFNLKTREYLERLALRDGMKVLEVGAGTGRVTVDLGLCDMVGQHGSVVALDPNITLLDKLATKCRECGIKNVKVVQGVAETLPFPDNSFDATIAVACLHFTDAPKAVSEMVRVTKPGGFVSALNAPAEFDLRHIPMVALWFSPLTKMAESFGVPFGERNGLPVGLLKEIFEKNTENAQVWDVPIKVSAEDYWSFLAFFLRGAAHFQNIFCRLPYRERWGIIQRLEEDGAKIAAQSPQKEKVHVYSLEAAYGRVPTKTLLPK